MRRSRVRASDGDRDLVAERLYDATVEGRLLTVELDQRLGLALAARTYGELDPLVADLPGGRAGHPPDPRVPLRALATLAVTILLIVLGAIAWHRW